MSSHYSVPDLTEFDLPFTIEKPALKSEISKAYIKEHGIACASKGLFVGIVGVRQEVLSALQQGVTVLGKQLYLVELSNFDDIALMQALDVCVFAGEVPSQEELSFIGAMDIVPVLSVDAAKKVGLVEFEPTSEQGWGFTYPVNNPWGLFATMVRLVETRRFSYDWNTLRKRVLEAYA